MSIYSKLQAIKADLAAAGLKKSGLNKFAGYTYFELADFLPAIVAACQKYKAATALTFADGVATLTAIDTEMQPGDPGAQVTTAFNLPPVEPRKGENIMQAIGGAQTYARRYLFCAMFDLCEADAIDAAAPDDERPRPAPAKAKKADAPAPRYVPASERDELLCWLKDARNNPAAAAAIKDYLAAAKADRVTALGLDDLRRMVDSARDVLGAQAAQGAAQ